MITPSGDLILEDVGYIISWPVYGGPDADEPTGQREPVEVTAVRIDGDDLSGSKYYIHSAHRIVFGAAIPDGELAELHYLSEDNENSWTLLGAEEYALLEYVEARVLDERFADLFFR